MTRAAVEQLLYLLDEAFEGIEQPWHSVLGNLKSVTEEDWLWTPPGGARTIRLLTAHMGAATLLYDSHAFGDGTIGWNDPAGDLGLGMEDLQSFAVLDNEPPMADIIAWTAETYRQFRGHVAELEDADLLRQRPNHRRDLKSIRWFIALMVQHYTYHAGEINHIRALQQGNDR
jgi:hypothetical protein